MESIFESHEEVRREPAASLPRQTAAFFVHALLALVVWLGLMLAGYAWHPDHVTQSEILLASTVVPMIVGLIAVKIHPDETATVVWLLGLIWLAILALWILDLPTGPGRCINCSATEKLTRSFFSWPEASGLMDDDVPFLGTWPVVALMGYSFGAWFGMKGRR